MNSIVTERSLGSRIECVGVAKEFIDKRTGTTTVGLAEFSLDIRPQEIIAILGPSGCGKSTLLNIVAGFDKPTAGRVLLNGSEISGPAPDRGVVFQEHGLFPWLTVRQNVEYGLREKGMGKKERTDVGQQVIDMVGLQGFEDKHPHQISGGMRQRVGIARVLAIEPSTLLMDEPFGALDAQTRAILQRELLAIWERTRQTMIFVTHSVEEAVYLGHRVVVMTAHPGRIKVVLDIDLPQHERDVTAPSFLRYRQEAAAAIEAEVDRAMALQRKRISEKGK